MKVIEKTNFIKRYEICSIRVGADAYIGPRKVANLP